MVKHTDKIYLSQPQVQVIIKLDHVMQNLKSLTEIHYAFLQHPQYTDQKLHGIFPLSVVQNICRVSSIPNVFNSIFGLSQPHKLKVIATTQ